MPILVEVNGFSTSPPIVFPKRVSKPKAKRIAKCVKQSKSQMGMDERLSDRYIYEEPFPSTTRGNKVDCYFTAISFNDSQRVNKDIDDDSFFSTKQARRQWKSIIENKDSNEDHQSPIVSDNYSIAYGVKSSKIMLENEIINEINLVEAFSTVESNKKGKVTSSIAV